MPILKSGKPNNETGSYRPISLLSGIGKLFEKIIKEKLSIVMEDRIIIPQEQFGFRPSHNTTLANQTYYNFCKTEI